MPTADDAHAAAAEHARRTTLLALLACIDPRVPSNSAAGSEARPQSTAPELVIAACPAVVCCRCTLLPMRRVTVFLCFCLCLITCLLDARACATQEQLALLALPPTLRAGVLRAGEALLAAAPGNAASAAGRSLLLGSRCRALACPSPCRAHFAPHGAQATGWQPGSGSCAVRCSRTAPACGGSAACRSRRCAARARAAASCGAHRPTARAAGAGCVFCARWPRAGRHARCAR